MSEFTAEWNSVAQRVYDTSKKNGFWEIARSNEGDVVIATKLALIHSEISEALEALRNDKSHDDKLVQHSAVGVELADAVIRIMDLGVYMGYNLPKIIEDKMRYNESRPFKHGKKF